MKVVRAVDELPAGLRFALAIGMFDGFHRGHRQLIGALTDAAREREAASVVVTFVPHPAEVLRGSAPPLLCDPAEKLSRLEAAGVDYLVEQRFDRQFAEQTAEQFLERACANRRLVALVMTEESAFGRDRSGGLPAIRGLAPSLGLDLIEVAHLAPAGARISSTRLRNAIAAGRLGEARRMLGQRYAVIGRVAKGDRRGRELGYPTANLAFDAPVVLPPNGIYAVRVSWGSDDPLAAPRTAGGAASLGVRPTFESDGARVLEVHLLDFDEDLYGERLRVEFVRRLRGERRFASVAALVGQMERDVARTRDVLAAERPA